MLNKREISTKLKTIGFKDEEIDTVIADVVQVILDKSLTLFLYELPESEQIKLKQYSSEQIEMYLEENKDKLPQFSKGKFEKIYDDTWNDYFNSVSK